ncbi:hypothetical protein IOD13_02025 [Brevibacterium casei]|nr:hypothetical protein [Brevibacterium casei]
MEAVPGEERLRDRERCSRRAAFAAARVDVVAILTPPSRLVGVRVVTPALWAVS